MNEKELRDKYDRVLELDWEKRDIVKRQPLIIKHGFEPSDPEAGEPIKFDFRGIQRVDDIHIYAPEADVEIEHFDHRTDGDGIIAWVKKDWSDDSPVKIFWMEPTDDQVLLHDMTGVERIETPSTRKKRGEEDN